MGANKLGRNLLGLAAVAMLAGGAWADKNNQYFAPLAKTAPVIDGQADPVWDAAPWDSMPYNYLKGTTNPSPTDFSGRYKVLWDSSRVYLLVEIVDDSISDLNSDPLTSYWDDDALEIFVDENKNGGIHEINFKAWAYHLSTGKNDVVDKNTDGDAQLYNEHFEIKRSQVDHTSLWELSMRVYGETYTMAGPNTPLKLAANKLMGFTLAYCDNDGRPNRDNFMGSVNTPGHIANQGYINANCFGSLKLMGDSSATKIKAAPQPAAPQPKLETGAQGFRLPGPSQIVTVHRLDGATVDSFQSQPGVWYGSQYPAGVYTLLAKTPTAITSYEFRQPR